MQSAFLPFACYERATCTRALLIPILFLAITTPARADLLFSVPFVALDTGPNPVSVSVGDLNADARADLRLNVNQAMEQV